MLLLVLCCSSVLVFASVASEQSEVLLENEEHNEPSEATLFPSFTLTMGVVVFYILSRYLHVFPYTAAMFLLGVCMGLGVALRDDADHHVHQTVNVWTSINSEVLLLVFLPGLIYRDASGLNVHLFRIALVQSVIFAFPLVLAGTSLTAMVAKYILPLDWSLDLCLLFGAILSATDPVAVAALLKELGAPPRLKIHIAGEALLNDGAAIVFFSIFQERYLYEISPEFGGDIDWGRGFTLFLQKSLGGVAIGTFFGFGILFMLLIFNRRFNHEENVVEVVATVAVAYLGYYVAEPVWKTSGVISTVTTGIIVKFFGRSSINNYDLLEDFWHIVEHILNTILFTLGGVVWGSVVARGERDGVVRARDWGYLFLLYVMLTLIRGTLFLMAYPVTARIGLKSCWQEAVFQVWGGLRGAVGIALALALSDEVRAVAENESEQRDAHLLFFYVGGIVMMTLIINASTAGPLLRRLHLSDSSETRKKMTDAYRVRFFKASVLHMVKLLTQKRFDHVNFALVKHHVPHLARLTKSQLLEAVARHRDTVPAEEYTAPHLKRILPYVRDDSADIIIPQLLQNAEDTLTSLETAERRVRHQRRRISCLKGRMNRSTMRLMMENEPKSSKEFRHLFISILRAAYEKQLHEGELEDRTFLAIAFQQSLDLAEDAVANDDGLRDWEFATLVANPQMVAVNMINRRKHSKKLVTSVLGRERVTKLQLTASRLEVEQSMCFMAAHRWAQKFFRREFEDADQQELSETGKLIIQESQRQYDLAEGALHRHTAAEVELVASHKFCAILLNEAIGYVSRTVKVGLLKEAEAEEWVEEIEHSLEAVLSCDEMEHPGELQHDETDLNMSIMEAARQSRFEQLRADWQDDDAEDEGNGDPDGSFHDDYGSVQEM